MSKRRYSLFHPLLMSFYSTSLYRDVAKEWRGSGLGYLFILVIITWVGLFVGLNRNLTDFRDIYLPPVLEQLPTVTVDEGIVSIDQQVPYYIDGPEGEPILIIDTSGQYESLDDTPYLMLLTRDSFVIRKENGAVEHHQIPPETNFTFDDVFVLDLYDSYIGVFLTAIFFIGLIVVYIYRILQVIFYAALGKIFNALMGAKLDFVDLMRLSSVCLTPTMLFTTVVVLADIKPMLSWWWYVLVTLIYLIGAIYSSKKPAA